MTAPAECPRHDGIDMAAALGADVGFAVAVYEDGCINVAQAMGVEGTHPELLREVANMLEGLAPAAMSISAHRRPT